MTKYIFFDMDGVLTTDTTGSYTTAKFFADKFEIDFDELFQYTKPFDSDIDAGKLTVNEVWANVAEKYNKEFKDEYIKEAFLSTPIDAKMLEIVDKLKENYKVGIITDNSIERANAIFDKNGFREIFDTIIISGEVKSTKKSVEIFNIAAEKAGVECDECIFIDNNPNNAKVADEAGFKGIWFDDQARDYDKLWNEIVGE